MTGGPGPDRLAVPLVAAALVVLAAAAAAFSTLRLDELDRDPPDLRPPTAAPGAPPAAADQPTGPPELPAEEGTGWSWLGEVVLVVWLAAALVGLVLLLRALARRRGRRGVIPRLRRSEAARTPDQVAGEAPLLAAVDAGLVELSDDDRDPRRAVIACWVRLEEAAAAAGVPHHDADTAGDLVVRLLRARQVSEPVLAGLAEVYRLARYATHTVDEQMRTRARAALRQLREELLAAQGRPGLRHQQPAAAVPGGGS